MAIHTITLELPDEVYQRAQRTAEATQRSLEEVVLTWIRPPSEEELPDLERLSDEALIQVARTDTPPEHSQRLQELLGAQ